MTEAEALTLRLGDIVLARVNGKTIRVKVMRVYQFDISRYAGDRPHFCRCCSAVPCSVSVSLRRRGHFKQSNGRVLSYPSFARCPGSLMFAHDAVTANVYADWLDEHNFFDAAVALRKAFPMDDGKETT